MVIAWAYDGTGRRERRIRLRGSETFFVTVQVCPIAGDNPARTVAAEAGPEGQQKVAGGEAKRNHRLVSPKIPPPREGREKRRSYAKAWSSDSRAPAGAQVRWRAGPVVPLLPRSTTGYPPAALRAEISRPEQLPFFEDWR